jgi:hypothetical protein
MPSVNVSLDCRNWPSSGSDGYTTTTASNNALYSYKYSGGTDGNGNVDETVGIGAVAITVTIYADERYVVDSVGFSGDIESQLTSLPGNSPTSVVINDSDSQTGSGYFQLVVRDTTANCTFPCDPRITNKPN